MIHHHPTPHPQTSPLYRLKKRKERKKEEKSREKGLMYALYGQIATDRLVGKNPFNCIHN